MGMKVGMGVRLGSGQLFPESGNRFHRGGGILVFKKKDLKEVATRQVGIWMVGTDGTESKDFRSWQTPMALILTEKPDFPLIRAPRPQNV